MKWEKMRAYVYSGGGRQSFEGTYIVAYPNALRAAPLAGITKNVEKALE